ncbi:MAG: hypothetical protein Q8Q03_00225 [bacterium]|nr:hypothetical protein [bacterium]
MVLHITAYPFVKIDCVIQTEKEKHRGQEIPHFLSCTIEGTQGGQSQKKHSKGAQPGEWRLLACRIEEIAQQSIRKIEESQKIQDDEDQHQKKACPIYLLEKEKGEVHTSKYTMF